MPLTGGEWLEEGSRAGPLRRSQAPVLREEGVGEGMGLGWRTTARWVPAALTQDQSRLSPPGALWQLWSALPPGLTTLTSPTPHSP